MAKKRSSVFSTPATEKEIKQEAKAIETKALTGEEPKQVRPKYLYVSPEHHQKAKILAAQSGQNLREYIEGLLDSQAM